MNGADEPSTLALLQSTFASLDEWGIALATAFVPEPTSDLAADDSGWAWVPLSQVAMMGLGSARDHLQAVRVHIEARQLFPFAHPTLVRGAIIGAAQAVWVLSPEVSSERISRARAIAAEMYRNHRIYLDVLRQLPPKPHAGTEAVADHVRDRETELNALRRVAGDTGLATTTEIVRGAAQAAFGNDAALTDEAECSWRLTSGAAHGLSWALLGQPDTTTIGDVDAAGMAAFGAAGGLSRIVNSYMLAYHLATYGWALLRRLSAAGT